MELVVLILINEGNMQNIQIESDFRTGRSKGYQDTSFSKQNCTRKIS